MQMHEVRYFLSVCDELNFTRAAKRCGVAQPSLSKGIKRLEQTLGGALFIREGRCVQPTELGRQMQPYLRRMDQCDQEAKRKAKEFSSRKHEINFHSRTTEVPMRSHPVITIAAVLVVGFGIKMFYFPSQPAEAQLSATNMDIFQLQSAVPMKGLQEEHIAQPVEYDR